MLREAEAGTPVEALCRGEGISEATFYGWMKRYASLGVSKLRRLRPLETENYRLKKFVADLRLDRILLQEVIAKVL